MKSARTIIPLPAVCLSLAICCLGAGRLDGLEVRGERPRIWLDPANLETLRQRWQAVAPEDIRSRAGNSLEGRALAWLITGNAAWGREAVDSALAGRVDPGSTFRDLDSPDGVNKRDAVQPSAAQLAIIYDWCYPLLTAAERAALRNAIVPEMRRLMRNPRLWRSFHNTGHTSAWPVTAGALALHGDDPVSQEALEFLKPELEDALLTFDTLFGDGEWPEGFDYNRHSTFAALRTLLALKSGTGRNLLADSPHFRNAGLYILYSAKPNGLVLPADDNDWPYLGHWEQVGLLMLAAEYRDGYIQHFLNHCPEERFRLPEDEKWAHLLWYDPTIPERDPGGLPKARLFRGKGLVIARSGWDWDGPQSRSPTTWLSFHCGDYFGDHAHYHANTFELYHRGELAIDSGRYDSDWDFYNDPATFPKSQFFNYYQRTIAHNTMLVYDPEERLEMGVANDGGQLQLLFQAGHRNAPEDYAQGVFPSDSGRGTRDWTTNPGRWETGDIVAYESNNRFTYVRGDATRAYSAHKLQSFVRSLLFLQPDMVVVFDRVLSTRPNYQKTWLLHTVEQPSLSSSGALVAYGEGKMQLHALLPRDPSVRLVGGPGREFVVGDREYRCCLDSPINPAPLHYGEIPGGWRIEISPQTERLEDYFLNVLTVGPLEAMDPVGVELRDVESGFEVILRHPSGRTWTLRLPEGSTAAPELGLELEGRQVFHKVLARRVELEPGRPD